MIYVTYRHRRRFPVSSDIQYIRYLALGSVINLSRESQEARLSRPVIEINARRRNRESAGRELLFSEGERRRIIALYRLRGVIKSEFHWRYRISVGRCICIRTFIMCARVYV